MQGKTLSADLIDSGSMTYSSALEVPWMETAVIVMVGLMFIFALAAICFLYHQKNQDAQERMQREAAEREER